MDEEINGPLAKLKEARQHQQIYFADLYHFFIPGEEVYRFHGSGINDNVQAYRVLQVTGGRRFNLRDKPHDAAGSLEAPISDEVGSPLVITCVHLDFDGREFGPITTSFSIKEYIGERSTKSLPIIPKAFIKNLEDLTARLESRGCRFIELAQVAHKEYTGLTVNPVEDIDSQVIIDFDTTFQANPSWAPSLDIQYPAAADPRETAPFSRNDNDEGDFPEPKGKVLDSVDNEYCWMLNDASIDQTMMKDVMDENPIFRRDPPVLLKVSGIELNNNDKQLLPGRVFGFILRSRTWAELSIGLVKDLPVKQDGFDQLVLPEGHKDLVLALVETHSRGSRPASGPAQEKDHQVDLVKGKGKGLIMLLHGAPGVGKTSTAECIADYTQRPLFPITCGDLGETATSVETNLGKSFQLARKWGCVLLLDEADVFMGERSGSDVQRNSLVSVFLRILEYYSGILFLTTNRVGVIDPAFKSRIHISLYYPPLDDFTTIKIWEVNIARLKASEKKYEVDEGGIIGFAKRLFRRQDEGGRWNGRQIRNAFQTAMALAEYDATKDGRRPPPCPRITVNDFRKVATAAFQFDQYLREVFGGRDEAARAFNKNLRKDDWGQKRPPMRGGNSSYGYYQRASYRQQQPQRSQGPNMYNDDPSLDDDNYFQESKNSPIPNEVDPFSKRPSPGFRSMTQSNRGGYNDFNSPSSGRASPGNYGYARKPQTMQTGQSRTLVATQFDESEYRRETSNDFDEFDEGGPGDVQEQGREGQTRTLIY